jgi:N-acetyl-alpha-D-glucosaminyl L-malate synthase BshA
MNIGIALYPTVGGSGGVAAELAKHLARRGHSVHVVSYRLPFRLADFHENIRTHEVDLAGRALFEHPPHELALAAKLCEVAREASLDLFHVHYAMPHAIAAHLAREMLGAKAPRLVTTLHGTDTTLVGEDASFAEITRFGIERSDAVTAVSEFLRRETLEELGVTRPIDVVPNFVDTGAYCPTRAYKDETAFCAPGDRMLLHASNFQPSKRVLDVIRIFERVQREVPSTLLLVGEGPERSAARALARRLGVAERVRFLGQQDDTSEIAGMADVFLLPSELESFGQSALEAMACAVPVVGTDQGGLPELVKHAETGYLLPVGDVEGMAARVAEILKDDERRRELGEAGRRRAAALFGADRVVSRYERIYERVLSAA